MARLVRATQDRRRSAEFRGGAVESLSPATEIMGRPDKPGDDDQW
jgi:hypothetical protein